MPADEPGCAGHNDTSAHAGTPRDLLEVEQRRAPDCPVPLAIRYLLPFYPTRCAHVPSSHLVVRMPTMKTTAANTPMTAEYRSAVMLSANTMEARSPSFT